MIKTIPIYNSFLPVKGFTCMTILLLVFIRKEYKDYYQNHAIVQNHENIHAYQQIELFLLSVLIYLVVLWFGIDPWWGLFSFLVPFAVYVLCWIVEILLPPYNSAYKDICFENEAYKNQSDLRYLNRRGLFTFKFLKYIKN